MNIKEVKAIADTYASYPSIIEMIGDDTSTENVLLCGVSMRLKELNELLSAESIAPGSDSDALSRLQNVINALNSLHIIQRLEELQRMSWSDAYHSYMDSQTIEGMKAVKDKDECVYRVDNREIEISFYDVMKVCRPTEVDGLLDAIEILADNCVRFENRSTGKDDQPSIARKGLSRNYLALRKRWGWDKCDTRKECVRQLNELVSKFILPEGEELKMIPADQRYIAKAVVLATSKANSAGGYTQRNDETLCGFIFRAMYTRKNGLPYAFQTSRGAEKAPRTYKENKDMAEQETHEDKDAPGGSMTVKAAESSKSKVSKSKVSNKTITVGKSAQHAEENK